MASQRGKKAVAVRRRVKFLQEAVLAEIQGVMGMPPFGACAGGVPAQVLDLDYDVPPILNEAVTVNRVWSAMEADKQSVRRRCTSVRRTAAPSR